MMNVDCQPDSQIKAAAVPFTFQSTDEAIDDYAVFMVSLTQLQQYDLPRYSNPNLLALSETHNSFSISSVAELNILYQQQVTLLRYLLIKSQLTTIMVVTGNYQSMLMISQK